MHTHTQKIMLVSKNIIETTGTSEAHVYANMQTETKETCRHI